MALRAGRAWFSVGMRHFGSMTGVNSPAFRKLSMNKRHRLVLGALVEIFNHFSDQAMQFEETGTAYRIIIDHSPFAEGIKMQRPACHIIVGLLQESMRWASNGRDYVVRESQCTASGGNSCIFVIQK